MAFNIRLWHEFTKRDNSTKRPRLDDPASIVTPIKLKDPSSIYRPTIVLGMVPSPVGYNYAYIPNFGDRYYFIRDWRWVNGLWEADLEEDVLGTWQYSISASTQYVLRSSHSFDGAVQDGLYPTKAGITLRSTTTITPWAQTLNGGRYVVGIINADTEGVGAVSYYIFTAAGFNALCAYLLDSSAWLDIEDISENLQKALFNPLQYVASCTWFPFVPPYEEEGSLVRDLKFGWWTLPGITCRRLAANPLHQDFVSLPVPKHPQSATRGTYLNIGPYTRYTLAFPPFGLIPVDPMPLYDASDLYAIFRVDCITGEGVLFLSPSANYQDAITEERAMVGVPIQLAQIYRDYMAVASNVVSTAASATSAVTSSALNILGGNVGGAISGIANGVASVANGIMSTVESAMPQLRSTGSQGSLSSLIAYSPFLYCQFFPLVDEDNDDRGRPLCAKRQLSSIPGYILVADADIEIRGTKEEAEIIKRYMESGFFLELDPIEPVQLDLEAPDEEPVLSDHDEGGFGWQGHG